MIIIKSNHISFYFALILANLSDFIIDMIVEVMIDMIYDIIKMIFVFLLNNFKFDFFI